jgi:hypothetical protein
MFSTIREEMQATPETISHGNTSDVAVPLDASHLNLTIVVPPTPKENQVIFDDDSDVPSMLAAEKIHLSRGNTKLLYSAPISGRISLFHLLGTQIAPWSCAVCLSVELQKATYVHLYEDRLEWNYPHSVCCTLVDNPGVVYLDRDVAQRAVIPECCRPLATHCCCCPTWFDSCGEMVVLTGKDTPCICTGARVWHNPCGGLSGPPPPPLTAVPLSLPCMHDNWLRVPFLADAQELKYRIRAVRRALEGRLLAKPAVPASLCIN